MDVLERPRHRLHRLDDPAELLAYVRDLGDPLAHLVAKPVHLHGATRHGCLHVANHAFDVLCGERRLIGQSPDFLGHDPEAASRFARLLRLDRGIHGEQVGLVGHLGDRGDHRRDAAGPLADRREFAGECVHRLIEVLHRGRHALEPAAARVGHPRGLARRFRHLARGPEQLLAGGGDLGNGRGDLRGRATEVAHGTVLASERSGRLLLHGREPLAGRLDPTDQAAERMAHPAERPEEAADLVVAPRRHLAGQIPLRNRLGDLERLPHRIGDRPRQPERREHARQADDERRGEGAGRLPPEHVAARLRGDRDEDGAGRAAVRLLDRRGDPVEAALEPPHGPVAGDAIAHDRRIARHERQIGVGGAAALVDPPRDERIELQIEDPHLADFSRHQLVDQPPQAEVAIEPVEKRRLHPHLHDPWLVDAADARVFEDAAIDLPLARFLDHHRHVAAEQPVKDVCLRLLGRIWGEREINVAGLLRDAARGIGREDLVDDCRLDDLAKAILQLGRRHAGLLGHRHELRNERGLRLHLPADLLLHLQRHLLREGHRAGERFGDAIAAGLRLLQDGPPRGEGLQERVHRDGGEHEQRGDESDSGPQRHAMAPRRQLGRPRQN